MVKSIGKKIMGRTAQPSRGFQNMYVPAVCPKSQGDIGHVMSDIGTFILRVLTLQRVRDP